MSDNAEKPPASNTNSTGESATNSAETTGRDRSSEIGSASSSKSPSPLTILVVGEEPYSPWQQVYSLLRRLPPGTRLVSDPSRRVGDMVRKACNGHELEHVEAYLPPDKFDWSEEREEEIEEAHVWQMDHELVEMALFYHMGDDDEPMFTTFREMAFDLLSRGVVVLEVRPETYPQESDLIVNLAHAYTQHGMPT